MLTQTSQPAVRLTDPDASTPSADTPHHLQLPYCQGVCTQTQTGETRHWHHDHELLLWLSVLSETLVC